MKLAIVLLCVVAAAQGRSTAVQVVNSVGKEGTPAALGENPWVAHLRLATSTSGFLESCVGSLISESWVLTTADCVNLIRFVWIRLGAPEVIRPERVYEASAAIPNSDWNPVSNRNNVALINLNRVVDLSENIAVIALAGANEFPVRASYCSYGEERPDTAGEWLNCWDVTAVVENPQEVVYEGDRIPITKFDSGAPLASDGVLLGLLSHPGEFRDEAVFVRVSGQINWIAGMTGLDFSRAAPAPEHTPVIIVDQVADN